MSDSSQPVSLPLCSHGGILDDLNHATAIAGTSLSCLKFKLCEEDEDILEILENVKNQLRRIDALSRMTDQMARAGTLEMPEPRESDIEWWAEASQNLSEVEQDIVARSARVRP